jgi:uncharacterized membrane protein required for colicin V production
MNIVDYGIIIAAAIGAVGGFFKGAVRNLVTVAGICLGVFLGMRYSSKIAATFKDMVPKENVAEIISFIAILVVSFVLFRTLALYGERGVVLLRLKGMNRLAGAAIGGVEGALVAVGVVFLLQKFLGSHVEGLIDGSLVAPKLMPLMQKLVGKEG